VMPLSSRSWRRYLPSCRRGTVEPGSPSTVTVLPLVRAFRHGWKHLSSFVEEISPNHHRGQPPEGFAAVEDCIHGRRVVRIADRRGERWYLPGARRGPSSTTAHGGSIVTARPELPRRVPGANLPTLPVTHRRRFVGRVRAGRRVRWSNDPRTMARLIDGLRQAGAGA
jgi:hypothetical protein